MAILKTSGLTGSALNFAVRWALSARRPADYVEARDNFSTCWSKAGPIIEREEIGVVPTGDAAKWEARQWVPESLCFREAYGTTPLIAAMRCFVASKLGDSVDIPDALA